MAMKMMSTMLPFWIVVVGILITAIGTAVESTSHDATSACLAGTSPGACTDAGQILIALGLAILALGIGWLLVAEPDMRMGRG